MEQGAGETAINGVRLAIESLLNKQSAHGTADSIDLPAAKQESKDDTENLEMDILCMAVATLTNLALTSSTRTLIINDGVVPIILHLIEPETSR